jgi:hypothetical protein
MEISVVDWIFIISAVLFNLLIAGIFILQKHKNPRLTRYLGVSWLCLAIPLMVVFFNYLSIGKPTWIIICFGVVFFYMVVELLLDYILKIDFRARWITHTPYILLEYAALFSLIAISIDIHPTLGWIVAAAFWILMGSLIYLYAGGKRKKKT